MILKLYIQFNETVTYSATTSIQKAFESHSLLVEDTVNDPISALFNSMLPSVSLS